MNQETTTPGASPSRKWLWMAAIAFLAIGAVTRGLRHVDAGGRPGPLLRLLDAMGIGLSS